MSKYKIVLQILAIFIICFLIYLLYRFIISIIRKNRINNFSINITNENMKNDSMLFRIIYFLSDILEKMVIFNSVARTYDRYTYQDKDLKKGMDYISIKILLGFSIIFLYLFVIFLYRDGIEALTIFICFILGFVIPDFYCMYLESKNKRLVNKDMLRAIIIMNNSFKANRSAEQAIGDVISRVDGPIKIEYTKVLNDVRFGLTISEAFKRMYDRTKIKIVLEMSHILSLTSKSGANIIDIFEDIESKLLEEEKLENELKEINSINILSYIVFMILPVVFLGYLILFNDTYIKLFLSNRGILVILTILIMYLLYLIIMWRVVKGVCKND